MLIVVWHRLALGYMTKQINRCICNAKKQATKSTCSCSQIPKLNIEEFYD